MLFEETADDYLPLIEEWQDPNPDPVLTWHDGIVVVRDDLLEVGSKVRSIDYLIGHAPEYKHVKEWVFGGCPATGYAQMSLPYVCSKYDKKAILFMAKRNPENYHEYQKRGMEYGATYKWVNMGMLTVTKKRAQEYYEENKSEREVLPLGLEHPTVIASTIKVARSINYIPSEVWTVGSSGTLNRSLQLAWPDADIHVVSVGHKMTDREIGRATMWRSELKFDKPVINEDHIPPFPSAPTYDAKAWKFIKENAKYGALFWNVGA